MPRGFEDRLWPIYVLIGLLSASAVGIVLSYSRFPELASCTLSAPTAAEADALATMAMVVGPSRTEQILEELPGCEAYLISKQLEVTQTAGFITV